MSLSSLIFGDFDVAYTSGLSISEAMGRLAGMTGQPGPSRGGGEGGALLLHGYATAHEVVLRAGSPWHPFIGLRPYFKGRFIAGESATELRGKFVAEPYMKIWIGAGLVLGVLVLASNMSGASSSPEGDGVVRALAALGIIAATLIALRMAMRPRAAHVQVLERAIREALMTEGLREDSPTHA